MFKRLIIVSLASVALLFALPALAGEAGTGGKGGSGSGTGGTGGSAPADNVCKVSVFKADGSGVEEAKVFIESVEAGNRVKSRPGEGRGNTYRVTWKGAEGKVWVNEMATQTKCKAGQDEVKVKLVK